MIRRMKQRRRRTASVVLILVGAAAAAVAVALSIGAIGRHEAKATDGAEQTSTPTSTRPVGASGQPIPRFVSLKSSKVNVRRGPSNEHQVAWVYSRQGLPVEIIAEFEHWRRIRDSDGEEGWVYHSLLSGRRTATVSPWKEGGTVLMRQRPDDDSRPVAQLQSGVLATVQECSGTWCRLEVGGYSGWLHQNILWGVYPGEKIN